MRVFTFFRIVMFLVLLSASSWMTYYVVTEFGPMLEITRYSKKTMGTLVEIEEERSYEEGVIDMVIKDYVYFPVIEYVVEGEYFRIRGQRTFDKNLYSIGSKERITYNPLNPQHAFHEDRLWKDWLILLTLIITNFFLYWCCYAFYKMSR